MWLGGISRRSPSLEHTGGGGGAGEGKNDEGVLNGSQFLLLRIVIFVLRRLYGRASSLGERRGNFHSDLLAQVDERN